MHHILTGGALSPRKNLLLIIGKDSGQDMIGTYLFPRLKGDELNAVHELKKRSATIAGCDPMIALALSGGGSRAIAFHLGCLRALNERGVLQKVSVISAVSWWFCHRRNVCLFGRGF